MDRSRSSSSILCTVEQRKLPSSSSSTKRSCYQNNNNNIGATTNTTNMMKKKKKKQEGDIPMKVVYISNPVRFKVTPSEFRSLVQELTGQDSEDLHLPNHHQLQFNDAPSSCSTESIQFNKAAAGEKEDQYKGVSSLLLQEELEQVHQETTTTTTTTTTEEEEDDPLGLLNDVDVFTPLENLSDLFFFPNSSAFSPFMMI